MYHPRRIAMVLAAFIYNDDKGHNALKPCLKGLRIEREGRGESGREEYLSWGQITSSLAPAHVDTLPSVSQTPSPPSGGTQ